MPEIYRQTISPLLDHFDSESAHDMVRNLFHIAETNPLMLDLLELFAYKHRRFTDERLRIVVGGVELENPVLVGAGWDKKGKAVKALHRLGFSGVEVGTVLAYPQKGNPKPRQWVVGPGVVINHLGFNSPGMVEVSQNLDRYKGNGIPIGVSIGKNRNVESSSIPDAYAFVAERMYEYASYFAINVSSPNTPGLRSLQDKKPLTDIVAAINQAMILKGGRKPLFIKIGPDLTTEAVDEVLDVAIANEVVGIIATNTTTDTEIKDHYHMSGIAGGLSGNDAVFRSLATQKVRHIYQVAGDVLEIIGVGGINSAETALEKIMAGAKAVQVVTAMREVGPSLPGRINRGIVDYMQKEGVKSIQELVGQNVR